MKINFKVLHRRLLETFISGSIVSVVATILGLVYEFATKKTMIISVAAMIVFLGACYYFLRSFRLTVPSLKRYYKYNITAMAIYGASATACATIMHFTGGKLRLIFNIGYTFLFYLFRIPRFFSYSATNPDGYSIGNTTAALIATAACILFVVIAPIIIFKPKKVVEKRRLQVPRYKDKKEATHHHDKENKD